jgi:hypothetical protein
MKNRVGFGVGSGFGSISQRYGCGDPDPHQNAMDPPNTAAKQKNLIWIRIQNKQNAWICNTAFLYRLLPDLVLQSGLSEERLEGASGTIRVR